MLTYEIQGDEETGSVDDFIKFIKPFKHRFNTFIYKVDYISNTEYIFKLEINFGAVDVVCRGLFEKNMVKELQTKLVDLIF